MMQNYPHLFKQCSLGVTLTPAIGKCRQFSQQRGVHSSIGSLHLHLEPVYRVHRRKGGGLRFIVRMTKTEIDREANRSSKESNENMPKDIDVIVVGSCVQDLVR